MIYPKRKKLDDQDFGNKTNANVINSRNAVETIKMHRGSTLGVFTDFFRPPR